MFKGIQEEYNKSEKKLQIMFKWRIPVPYYMKSFATASSLLL